MRRTLIIILSVFSLNVLAQKVKTIEGEYTYHAPENVSLQEARNIALYRAQIQALADEFGTLISQSNITQVDNSNGASNTSFLSLGSSDVKGEWIETIGTPEYQVSYDQDMLVITCRVKGKAREILSASIEYHAKILKNGVEDRFESHDFLNGDALYLSFQSPVKGFLAVYLVDAEEHAYCILPYRNQQTGVYPILANQRYLFFDMNNASETDRVFLDEYYMTCSGKAEQNQIYVIFSPNQFVKAMDVGVNDSLPRELKYEDFQKWLVKCRLHDKDMQLTKQIITIKP